MPSTQLLLRRESQVPKRSSSRAKRRWMSPSRSVRPRLKQPRERTRLHAVSLTVTRRRSTLLLSVWLERIAATPNFAGLRAARGLLLAHDMKRLSRVRQQRRQNRGFGLLEIIVTIAIIAMISGAVAVAVTKHADKAKISMTKTNARTIRAGIKTWWIDHDSSSCPNVKMLIDDGALERGKTVKADGWGEPWRIVCEGYDVTVSSKGPDKKLDTEDDIHEPSG